MRLLVDALAARTGGLATYVRGLLLGWSEAAPQDVLTVFVTGTFGELLAADPHHANHQFRVLRSKSPGQFWRLARTEFLLPAHQRNVDALLATTPTIPLAWRKPGVIVVHDLRHVDRPKEFSLEQQLTRHILYGRAYRHADRILAISQRVADDLVARYPLIAPRLSVAPHGTDHVAEWQSSRTGDAIAFGHLSNKDPRLLVSTWKRLVERSEAHLPTLHVVGLDKPSRASLRRHAARLNIEDRVISDPYLPGCQLERLMRSASALLFPSRYEGFGLPVLEAMRQGVPVVISPDRALHEVAGGYATEAAGWTPAQFGTAVQRALSMTTADVDAARDYARQFTWRRSAEITRSAIAGALS